MFYTLLIVTFLVSLAVAALAVRFFDKPADAILKRIIQDDIYSSWLKYLKFATYVVAVSSGVRIHALERYISPRGHRNETSALELTAERWILELYRTIIEALQGLAWVFLIFFLVALFAFVIVRIVEVLRDRRSQPE